MPTAEHHRKLEAMYHGAPINDRLFHSRLTVSEGKAEVDLDFRDELCHAARSVHGSVYFKLLDDAAYFAVSSLVDDAFIVTSSFTIYMTRPATKGTMRATGEVVYASRRLWVAEAVLLDDRNRQIARGSGTFMKSRTELRPELGYR